LAYSTAFLDLPIVATSRRIESAALTVLRVRTYSDTMPHTRRTVITAPVPTVEQVARRLGVPRRRVERLERLIDSFIRSGRSRRHAARRRKAKTKRER